MQASKKVYKPEKVEVIKKILASASKYPIIVACKLHKVRGRQLAELRKNFRSEMSIIVAKNRIASIGLRKALGEKIDPFVDKMDGQTMLIFTSMNPFKLQRLFDKGQIDLPAKGGDIATSSIMISAGNTGIAPGPVLSEFKEAKIPTKIEAESIFITKDAIVAKPGDIIEPKLAGLLSRLGLKPIKAGLSLSLAYEDGMLYEGKDVKIDISKYESDFVEAYKNGLGLAVEVSYLTKESVPILLLRSFRNALVLALETDYLADETTGIILAKAERQANAIKSLMDKAPADKPAEDKAPADKPAEDKAPADKPAEDKAPADKPAEDKAPADKPA
ncbi:MAG: 50S ribosomal protein L10, partial [Thaumarchaeota archaeon]|nr:50S ribosomal protein L10 [Nitrososphaerota archaeon]